MFLLVISFSFFILQNNGLLYDIFIDVYSIFDHNYPTEIFAVLLLPPSILYSYTLLVYFFRVLDSAYKSKCDICPSNSVYFA
jgi:hypothetical protein